jgi:hypothetical protein
MTGCRTGELAWWRNACSLLAHFAPSLRLLPATPPASLRSSIDLSTWGYTMKHQLVLSLSAIAFAALTATEARAAHNYVTIHDDGTLANPITTDAQMGAMASSVVNQYAAAGKPIPDVLSVWTAFPQGGQPYGTYFVPVANDVTGIGLETLYGGDGTFASAAPPLRALLEHNDVTQLAARAQLQGAPVEGFAEYLFLLELSHMWGPALQVPATSTAAATELEGFPFHWSFFMDAGGSPAGGNRWRDDHDGTFTVHRARPESMTYSMLDLYAMGLADPCEVPPFGVLENVVVPSGVTDPLWGGPYSAQSFPWFSSKPFTVTATRRTLTIDDIIAANGTRKPARAQAPHEFTLGIVLVVAASATDADVAKAEAVMDPVSERLAPAFHAATHRRGRLRVVSGPVKSGA